MTWLTIRQALREFLKPHGYRLERAGIDYELLQADYIDLRHDLSRSEQHLALMSDACETLRQACAAKDRTIANLRSQLAIRFARNSKLPGVL